jgi:hypothetical protein
MPKIGQNAGPVLNAPLRPRKPHLRGTQLAFGVAQTAAQGRINF